MLSFFLVHSISLSINKRDYHYFIDDSLFQNLTQNRLGGALLIENEGASIAVFRSLFERNTGETGGGFYISGKYILTCENSFKHCSVTSIGGSLYQKSQLGYNNHLNSTQIGFSTSVTYANWCLEGGNCFANSVNTSLSNCPFRETGGHFVHGPKSGSLFTIDCGNIGKAVYGLYSNYEGNYYYEYSLFHNNTVGSLGIVICWRGSHIIRCSVFVGNTGIVSSSGEDIYIGQGSLIFNTCAFDTLVTGYYTTTQNCMVYSFSNSNYLDALPITCEVSRKITYIVKANSIYAAFFEIFLN